MVNIREFYEKDEKMLPGKKVWSKPSRGDLRGDLTLHTACADGSHRVSPCPSINSKASSKRCPKSKHHSKLRRSTSLGRSMTVLAPHPPMIRQSTTRSTKSRRKRKRSQRIPARASSTSLSWGRAIMKLRRTRKSEAITRPVSAKAAHFIASAVAEVNTNPR